MNTNEHWVPSPAYERMMRRAERRKRLPVWKPAACPEMLGDNEEKRCVKCGTALTGRQQRWCSQDCVVWYVQNHQFNSARRAIQDSATNCAMCGESLGEDIEVDHIEAAGGAHGVKSCVHHLSNLRALHTACHRERTRLQRKRDEHE